LAQRAVFEVMNALLNFQDRKQSTAIAPSRMPMEYQRKIGVAVNWVDLNPVNAGNERIPVVNDIRPFRFESKHISHVVDGYFACRGKMNKRATKSNGRMYHGRASFLPSFSSCTKNFF
jgi:hypothetical protein